MVGRMFHKRRVFMVLLCVALGTGCPPVNSKPCATDSECTAEQRCRRGACGPICLDDSECGDGQSCVNGVCAVHPMCAKDTDCAVGFSCQSGACACLNDSACAANQQCVAGACQARKRCTADADCLSGGGHCEVTQGLCLPQCEMPQDCAPTLDPNVAFAIYTCVQGTCTRRCTTDLVCGASGFICLNGLCKMADCKTASDCPPNQYCTSATAGRCLSYTTCTNDTGCPHNYQCKQFTAAQCPPGFDCAQKVCLELPACLADGDCVSGIPGTQQSMPTGFCEEGHCQPSGTCTGPGQCGSTRECIAGVCVPSVCRGTHSCGEGKACVDGTCVSEPAAADLALLKVLPDHVLLVEGDSAQLGVSGYTLDGSSYPLSAATFTVLDAAGAESTSATVTPAGVVTAVSAAGALRVRVSVTGSAVVPVEALLTVLPKVTSGRRVVVLDAGHRQPLNNVKVFGCLSAECATPTLVTTGVDGVALFSALGPGPATFTANAAALRSDGLPSFERASIIGTEAADVLLPLRDNPVRGGGGFSASMSFSDVSTTGGYWAGFVTTSTSDLTSLTASSLVGDSFMTQLPGINQSVPIPSTVVLYTSPGLGIPQQVKPRSLGLAQSGKRFTAAWAGRANLDAALLLRSTDFLGYLGAFDYALDLGPVFASRPFVPDTADVNGNGLCANPVKCPMGTENVPDYANFTTLTSQPRRQQKLRTEVLLPKLQSAFSTVLVASVQVDPFVGVLPTGFSSRTAGAQGGDGFRTLSPVTLRSGPPYGGIERSTPGIWALATNAAGTAYSGRLVTAAALPTSVTLPLFLPALAGATYSSSTRQFTAGQPSWSGVATAGAKLAQVGVTGTQVRHVIYFALSASQPSVTWPVAPAGPGVDPATEATASLEVVALALHDSSSADDVFSASGANLSTLCTAVDAYSRLDK